MNRQRLVVAAAAAVAAVAKGGTAVAHAAGSGWNWFVGDERAHIGGPRSGNSLELFAIGDVNVTCSHVRLVSRDGNFEFEHDPKVATSTLNAYVDGTGTRTPITIGGWDAQDIVSLIVGGAAGQRKDIQQWRSGGTTVAAIDGSGHLRLGPLTLVAAVEGGRAMLYAQLPDGSRQVLAAGSSEQPVASTAKKSKQATRPARSTLHVGGEQ